MSDNLDLDALEALAEAAIPTPWRWAGNTDHDDPRIEGGPRRYYVMGVRRREREKDDRQTQDFERYMQECEQFDPSLNEGKGGYRYLTDEEIAEAVRNDWLSEPNGEPRYDDRLSFINVDTKLMEYARDLATYAVCPEATSRNDERVYRADITGVRNPNAELMVAAVNALPELVAEVRKLREQVAHPPLLHQADADGSNLRLVEKALDPDSELIVVHEVRLLREQRDKVLALHTEFEGRCTECVEWCDCLDAELCTHGNVEWPCRTAAIFSPALPAQGQRDIERSESRAITMPSAPLGYIVENGCTYHPDGIHRMRDLGLGGCQCGLNLEDR